MQTRHAVADLAKRDLAGAATVSLRKDIGSVESDLRARFLARPDETDLTMLRPVIAGSWRRCVAWKAPLDPAPVSLGPDIDQWVVDSAEPAIRTLLRAQNEGEGCVVVGDRFGTVASLRGTPAARHWAERFFARAGTSLAEDVAGTNCIGTAIEEERGLTVAGAEHLSSRLEDCWSCSALVRDPLRRSVRAVLGVVMPMSCLEHLDPDGLGAGVEQAAAEVADVLTAKVAAREHALLAAYLRQARKRGAQAVMAIDGRTTIANEEAIEILGPRAQPVLAAYAREARVENATIYRKLSLEDGSKVEVCVDPVECGGELVGSVLALRPAATCGATPRGGTAEHETDPCAGLVGSSPLFVRTVEHARRAIERAAPALIVGEAGTGKRALALAIAGAWGEGRCLLAAEDLQTREGVRELKAALDRAGTAVIFRGDLVPAVAWTEVEALLESHPSPRLVITARRLDRSAAAALRAFGCMQIEMPALRARSDDVPALASAFLGEVPNGPRRISPRLLKTLTATDLPGNVAELREIVISAASRCAGKEITIEDLTAEHRQAVVRTALPPLQAAEVMQIQEALREAEGNRVKAAEILRIGRSTLYRRLEKYTRLGCDL